MLTTTSIARLGAELREPLFGQLVGHQHAMRRHPRLPSQPCFESRVQSTRGSERLDRRIDTIRLRVRPAVAQPIRDRALLADQDLLGGRDGPARLDVVAELGERHLEGRQRADHVELVGVAHVADPDDLSLELVLPADRRDAEPLGQLVADLTLLEAVGNAEGRQALGRPRAEELEPERLNAGLARFAHPAMALPDVFEPLFLDPPQGGSQRQDQRVCRRVGRVELFHLLAGRLEVEVIAVRVEGIDLGPGLGADRHERQARRHHQGFLRADAKQVDAPQVGPALHRADARDAVDREEGGRLGDDPADRLDRMARARRGLAQGAQDTATVSGCCRKRLGHLIGIDRLAPLGLERRRR